MMWAIIYESNVIYQIHPNSLSKQTISFHMFFSTSMAKPVEPFKRWHSWVGFESTTLHEDFPQKKSLPYEVFILLKFNNSYVKWFMDDYLSKIVIHNFRLAPCSTFTYRYNHIHIYIYIYIHVCIEIYHIYIYIYIFMYV